MSSRLRLAALPSVTFALAALASTLAACGAANQPQLKVLSVEPSVQAPTRNAIVFVEVVNRDERPMQLQRLEYTFAGSGTRRGGGEVSLTRVVEPGAGVVVEVPLSVDGSAPLQAGERLTLAGRLYCEQDQLVRSFPVTADVPPTVIR
ncbi:MAG TPA: hypothetical protein VHE35_04110 [Kofleriaceae bacterium]|nr:hypothetical protein [Kofleriaceae bacterium]